GCRVVLHDRASRTGADATRPAPRAGRVDRFVLLRAAMRARGPGRKRLHDHARRPASNDLGISPEAVENRALHIGETPRARAVALELDVRLLEPLSCRLRVALLVAVPQRGRQALPEQGGVFLRTVCPRRGTVL